MATLEIVSHEGHVALMVPPEMAERLRWTAGDCVEAEIVGDGLLTKPIDPDRASRFVAAADEVFARHADALGRLA